MRVLIAEDNVVSQKIICNYLQKWGYEYVLATDGGAAWQLLQQQDFPLVISDWLMPGMDGLELIRRIRGSRRPYGYVYTILLTAKSQKEDLVEAMEAGADDFLSKPFDRDELRVRLREGERMVKLERTLAGQAEGIVAGLTEAIRQLDQLRTRLGGRDVTDDVAPLLQQLHDQIGRTRASAETLRNVVRPQESDQESKKSAG